MAPGIAITPQGTENNGVSTYVVVFNDTPGITAASDYSLTSQVESLGGEVKYRYSIINGMAITIPDSTASELQSLPNVKYVEKDQQVHVLLNDSIPQIGANLAWAEGYKGDGVKIAIIDTGVDASHPDLNNGKVIAWKDFVNNRSMPYDDHGHGTHVSSIAAGTGNASGGKYTGVAPNASLIEAKVLDSTGSGYDSNIIAAIQWAIDNHAQVISMSLGSPSHDAALDAAVNNAVNSGVPVVIAAGNDGSGAGTIDSPGDASGAITVGAVDKRDVIASFSSRGPAYGGIMKPEVTNVGVNVVAACGSQQHIGTPLSSNPYYMPLSGTSMATPMTTGVVALMLQKNSSLTPTQVKSILEQTAKPLGGTIPNYNYGWGRVQANFAVDNVTGNTSGYSSSYLSDTLNSTIVPGDYNVSIIMLNNGTQPWSKAANVTLHSIGDAAKFSAPTINLTDSVIVQPGSQYTWSFDFNATMLGTFNLTYQMYVNNTSIGDILNHTLIVKDVLQPGTLQFNNSSYMVQKLSGSVSIRVDRVNGFDNTVGVNYTTFDGNGTAGKDYTATNGTLTFVQGQQNATFIVPIMNDGIYTGVNKTVRLSLSNPAGGANLGLSSANITIIDNNPQPVLQFNATSYTALSNQSNYTIAVKRTNNLNGPVSVNYTIGGGNATPGYDYAPATGTLNLGNGESSKSFNVIINGSNLFDNKTVNLTLSGFTNGSIPGSNASAVLILTVSQYTYVLVPGWNLISVPLNITDNTIDGFFPADVRSGIVDVWAWNESTQNWMYYSPDPDPWFASNYPVLTHVEAGRAYWVEMNKSASFAIQGTIPASAPASPIQLGPAWNFVGSTGLNSSAPDVLYPSNVVDIWGWNESTQNWMYYSPNPDPWFASNYPQLTSISTGHGYWVELPG